MKRFNKALAIVTCALMIIFSCVACRAPGGGKYYDVISVDGSNFVQPHHNVIAVQQKRVSWNGWFISEEETLEKLFEEYLGQEVDRRIPRRITETHAILVVARWGKENGRRYSDFLMNGKGMSICQEEIDPADETNRALWLDFVFIPKQEVDSEAWNTNSYWERIDDCTQTPARVVRIVRTGYGTEKALAGSVADLDAYKNEYADKNIVNGYRTREDCLEYISSVLVKYDAQYFEDKALIIVSFRVGSGSYKFGLQSFVVEDGCATISLREITVGATMQVMAEWTVFVECTKAEFESITSVELIWD